MERKREEEKQVAPMAPGTSGKPAKKLYRAPELVEWGSVENLTSGGGKEAMDATFPSS